MGRDLSRACVGDFGHLVRFGRCLFSYGLVKVNMSVLCRVFGAFLYQITERRGLQDPGTSCHTLAVYFSCRHV